MHPNETDLVLFAGGDLPLFQRLLVRRHISFCTSCRDILERQAAANEALQQAAAELPPGLNWDRLSAEMTANIHVGLEAGECVTPGRTPTPRITWRAAAVMASMSVVMAMAWWLNPPPRKAPAMRAPSVELRTTAEGLELNENGNALVLLHARKENVQQPIIISAPGALRARYVDSDTGQITINDVYAE